MHITEWRGRMEKLQCFMPGVLALGSYHVILRSKDESKPLTKYEKILIESTDQHLKLTQVLLESCVALYNEMPLA